MSFQEYVNWIYEGAVDLCDLSEEDIIILQADYELMTKEGLWVKENE